MPRDVPARQGRLFRGLAIACGLLALASCGGGSKAADEEPTLEERIGLDDDGLLEREAQAENLVRDCMRKQGFEYVPVDPRSRQAALTGRAGMTKEEFEKQYGYGITTLFEQRREQVAVGPNKEIRDAMSEADRLAYDRALYGEDPTATFFAALDSGDFSRLGGCTKEATDQVFGGTATIQTLQAKLDELDERIFADPEMVKVIALWSTCMRDAGFVNLREPHQVDAVLENKLEALVGPLTDQGSADEEPAYDKEALAALQHEEVAMVTADIACEKQHLASVEEAVTAKYDKQFKEENADLLSQVPAP